METSKATSNNGSSNHSPTPETSKSTVARSGGRTVTEVPPHRQTAAHSPPSKKSEYCILDSSSDSSLGEETYTEVHTYIVEQCQKILNVSVIDDIPEALKTLSNEHRALISEFLPDTPPDSTLIDMLKKKDLSSFHDVLNLGLEITGGKTALKEYNSALSQQSEEYMQSLDHLLERFQHLAEGQSTSVTDTQNLISDTHANLLALKENYSKIQKNQHLLKERYEQLIPTEGHRLYLEGKHQSIRRLLESLSKSASTSTQKRPADTSLSYEPTTAKKAKLKDSESSS
ncbi:hypothetical protein [Kistimonas asteriae]|uniref:hypothetical protein n=1 Tax=Kistimonas asteriae TaxID=517724 RepID=UPI001BA4702D|nr:hypothetical protein [Kistimonas asteriae]